MFVETCSLGCNSGVGGLQVSCSVVQVSLSTEVSIVFSEPVAPGSVNSTSFRLIDVGSGDVPVGNRFVDPSNPRRVVFRPAITFQPDGTANFGFDPLRTYRITIPGTEHGDTGPFIRSVSGKDNMSRMECDIQTTTTVDDLVPGPPTVQIFVKLADTSTPDPDDFIDNQPAAEAVDVWRDSTIRFVFNDIMNPATLANTSTQQSTLITVQVDTDGDFQTPLDRVTLFGTYVVTINLNQLQTVMLFTPANGMPSAGALPEQVLPRQIIVVVPPGVQDLASNLISNPGTTRFTPELVEYDPIRLPDANGENFTNTTNRDETDSGAEWGGGKLAIGWGGGSGRLGGLHVSTLETVTLDTDGTVFKNLSAPDPTTTMPIISTSGFLDNARPTGAPAGYDALDPVTWPTVTVTNGIFEFSSIDVDSDGILRLVGNQHGRLFSRGPVSIDGRIDVAGATPLPHLSTDPLGEPGGAGGPNAGAGGRGGDRPDNTGHNDLLQLTPPENAAIVNPGAVVDGRPGQGVGQSTTLASGKGGRHFPNAFPTSTENTDRGGLLYTEIPVDDFTADCRVRQVASGGGGGGYGVDGHAAVPMTPDPNAANPSPPPATVPNLPTTSAQGGDSAVLGIEPPDPQSLHGKRKLEPASLRGGSGGGGGGTHLYDTWQEGVNPSDFGGRCYDPDSLFTGISQYKDHSGSGGGGGGGAVQVVSGETMRVTGKIAANGGDGGSNATVLDFPRPSRASPGGGGAGGAVRLQAKVLNIDPNGLGRVDVSGGLGGVNLSPGFTGPAVMLGLGGDGGSGLIRLEDISAGTNPPKSLMTRCSEAPKLLPFDALDLNPNTTSGPCVGLPESEDHLSVGAWAKPLRRPDSYSGAVSCWIRPQGRFFTVQFDPDDLSVPTAPVYGWNMKVLYGTPPVAINYRGPDPNSPFGSGDFETNLGSQVNYLNDALPPGNSHGTGPFNPVAGGTYLAVRFQGAIAIADTSSNSCDVRLSGVESQIAPGSLTPWVRHPAELNEFFPRPNMLRYCIVFDRGAATPGSPGALIQGVTGLIIHAQPD